MRALTKVVALLCAACLPSILHAQGDPTQQIGLVPYQSYHGGDIDKINLVSGNAVIRIPLLSYPQRGGKLALPFVLTANTKTVTLQQYCPPHLKCTYFWAVTADVGGSGVSAVALRFAQEQIASSSAKQFQLTAGSPPVTKNFVAYTVGDIYSQHSTGLTTLGFESTDATGWFMGGDTYSGSGTTCTFHCGGVIGPDGIWYFPGGVTGLVLREDPNGNQIVYSDSTQTTILDTVGRAIPVPPAPSTTANFAGCTGPLPIYSASIWNPPGPNGGTVQYKLCYAQVTIQPQVPSCPNLGLGTPPPTTATLLQSVLLPNGTSWVFTYDTGTGAVGRVTFPTGGSISYTYGFPRTCTVGSSDYILTRTVDALDGPGGTSNPHTWSYTWGSGTAFPTPNTVTDPLGNDAVHTFGCCSASPYETQAQYYQGSHTIGTLLKTVTTDFTWSSNPNVGYSGGYTINVVPIRVTTIWPNGKQTKIEKDYDSGFQFANVQYNCGTNCPYIYTGIYGNVVAEREYDYGSGAPGPLLRQTLTTYQAPSNSNYLNNNLITLPASVTVKDGNAVQKAYTSYLYDESTPTGSGVTTQHIASPFGNNFLGNRTSVHRWLSGSTVSTSNCSISVSNGYLVSYNIFYDTGTVFQSTDSCGHSAGDANHTTTFAYSSTYAGAYPTTVTNPLSQATNHAYDFNTGLLTSTTDPNSQTTSFTYDSMWRLASVTYPDGGSATIAHQESTFPFTATLTQKITSSQNKVTTNIFDGVGRVSQSQLVNPDLSCPTIKTDLTYDALGRKSTASNPHCDSARITDGTTTYGYDALSRVTLITQPDSSTVQTAYCAGTTLVTDEASHWRRSTTDGLGRLIEVDEPNSLTATVNSNGCPGTGEPIWVTSYTYDTLDDLSTVVQNSSRNRSFGYDSLKRLTSATNPESGTTTYTYDADGNMVTKTVPAQDQTGSATVTLSYCYDVLNRMTSKAYTNQSCPMTSPVATYTYDQAACGLAHCSNIGHRTSMTDAAGSETWNYDVPDRISNDQRITNGVTKTVSYFYNYDHSIATLTYPTSRVITYTPDSAGRPSDAQDVANGINYATGICNNGNAVLSTGACYTPQGALGLIQNGANLVTTFLYNDRLQPCWTYATSGTPPTPLPWNTTTTNCTSTFATGSVLDLKYNFSLGTDNGNVSGITNDRVPNRSQNFTYDQLNRIAMAETTSTHATDPTNCWGETYVYDQPGGPAAWGNLIQINSPSSAYTGCTIESLNLTLGTLTNNQISGWCYDASGNLLAESTCPAGPPYAYMYDAENHLISTAGVTYTYDGDGKRVQKSSGMLYWYGMGSDALDETNSTGTMTDEYVFFGGKRIARRDPSNNVVYYFADHLGTSRVVVNAAGTIQDDSDFYPFGGERVVLSGSGNTYKFTGKERDSESGLDNFGARYYGSSIGRFVSADPFTVTPGRIVDPQQFNLYAYVRNNPLRHIDSTGMFIDDSQLSDKDKAKWKKVKDIANQKDKNGNYLHPELHNIVDKLQSDSRTFVLENAKLGAGTAGNFSITSITSDGKDFTKATLQLDFKKVEGISHVTGADLVPGFNKYQGLLDAPLDRLAETFGHEGGHGLFATQNPEQAVGTQQLLNQRDDAMQGLRYPYPPDVMQKIDAAEKALIPSEKFAQQEEKIVNGELQADRKKQ